jgi:hypothetical protein
LADFEVAYFNSAGGTPHTVTDRPSPCDWPPPAVISRLLLGLNLTLITHSGAGKLRSNVSFSSQMQMSVARPEVANSVPSGDQSTL